MWVPPKRRGRRDPFQESIPEAPISRLYIAIVSVVVAFITFVVEIFFVATGAYFALFPPSLHAGEGSLIIMSATLAIAMLCSIFVTMILSPRALPPRSGRRFGEFVVTMVVGNLAVGLLLDAVAFFGNSAEEVVMISPLMAFGGVFQALLTWSCVGLVVREP